MLLRMSETTQPSERVRAPGIVLAIFGGAGILMQLASWLFALIGMPFERMIQEKLLSQGGEEAPPEFAEFFNSGAFAALRALGIVAELLALALSIYVLWGGLQMLKLRHHGACIGAAIVAMIPCAATGCCCVFGIPIGIWVILVLNRADVRAAFGQSNPN